MTTFTVHTIPVAQPRQRHAVRSGYVHNYTPTKHPVNAFKAAVQWSFKEACSLPPLQGPVGLSVTFWLPRPKNMMWKSKPMPPVRHFKKPDLNNMVKALEDALTGLAWRDDSQICEQFISKMVCDGVGTPRVEIEITEL